MESSGEENAAEAVETTTTTTTTTTWAGMEMEDQGNSEGGSGGNHHAPVPQLESTECKVLEEALLRMMDEKLHPLAHEVGLAVEYAGE